ncbi:MAG: hypothetical protein ACMVY4_06825 [Minwuia sp.]|uniref:hypothetical protein n=1 Tax=Minwuia sp. TaxID=2493630 RepID=UPI003A8B51F5
MPPDGKREINWQFSSCPLESDPSRFGPFRDIVELWAARRPEDGGLPSRRGIDFYDLKGWHGRIAIAKIERAPFDVRFVLWGTTLTAWWGADYTNELLGANALYPDLWKKTEYPYFARMCRTPFIGVVGGYLDQHNKPHNKVIGLDLPMGDGRQVTHVLMPHVKVDLDQDIADVLPDCPPRTMFD